MATFDSSTDTRAPDSTFIKLDELAFLADSYKALQSLAMSHDGHNSPVAHVLSQLNKQFDLLIEQVDSLGLLS